MPTHLRQLPVLTLALIAGCHIVTGDPVRSPVDDLNSLIIRDVVEGAASGDTTSADDASSGTCGCAEAGAWYRFDSLKVTALDKGPHNAIGVLNSLWKNDIERHELNFFVRIEQLSDTEITLRVVNGARIDGAEGKACLLPYTEVLTAVPRQGCRMLASKPSDLNIYAGTESHKKNCAPANPAPHTIAAREVVMTAELSPDCSRVVDGKVVAGALPKAALQQTCLCVNPGQGAEVCGEPDASYVGKGCDGCNDKYQNLGTLLQNFQEPKWACSVGGEPAVCIEAEFSATRLDGPPPTCK